MITIDLSKEQALHSDPKAIQQINVPGNLTTDNTIFFIIKEVKETILDFSSKTVTLM